jgi:hypothetical protein
LRFSVSSTVDPSENVTDPEGVEPLAETVAVKVTLCPVVMLVLEVESVVVVAVRAGAVTVTAVALEALAAKVELPAYEAVIEWLPTPRLEVV